MPQHRQPPRRRSTCLASQGLPGAGGKGGPGVKGLSPASLGLRTVLFCSASPVSKKVKRPWAGGTGKLSCPPGGSPGLEHQTARSKQLGSETPGAQDRGAPAAAGRERSWSRADPGGRKAGPPQPGEP